jgi:hypothetical protein
MQQEVGMVLVIETRESGLDGTASMLSLRCKWFTCPHDEAYANTLRTVETPTLIQASTRTVLSQTRIIH